MTDPTASRRRLLLALAWTTAIVAVPILAWATGYLYWKVRIGRELGEARRNAAAWLVSPTPPSALLHRAGSRALPALLRELKSGVHRDDRVAANLFCRLFNDTRAWAHGDDSRQSALTWTIIPPDVPLASLRAIADAYDANWEEARKVYPPWWKWWDGKRCR